MSQDETERYQLQDQIGSGGMATVYRARDSVLQRVVALKLLNGGQVEPALKERFQREAQSVAQLSHENIVRIYDVGERDGSPYIVMEYVEGSNLKKRIQAHGPLTTHEAVEVVTQVGAALEYAHANGLIHCDVKPHNILISPNGRSKLVDFGIAQAQVDRTRRDSEQVYGTPLYMAPEQASGGRASSRTDVYGLGLVLWEALSGSPPERTGRYDPVKLDFDSAQIPHAFEEAIKRATAFDPDDRYVSVDDMVHAVATAVKDPEDREETTVPFRPDGAAHSSYRSVRPDRILPIPADDGASEPEPRVQRQRAEPARRPPQERVRRRRLTAPVVLLLLALLLLGSFAAWRYIQTGSAPWLSASSTVTAPVFRGMTLDEARAEGDRVGVQLTTSSDPASDEPEGTILSQDPGANAEVERGSTVALVVAGASEGAALPTGAPTEDAQTSPSPGATPTANLDPRENVAQLLAVGGPVRVQTIVDGDTRTYSLAEGGYLEVRGGRLRIRADQADRLAITLNGVSRGTLLELANQWADKSVPGPSAFIQTQSRPGVSNGDNNDD